MVNIGSALNRESCSGLASQTFYASECTAEDLCEQESLKDQDREKESKNTSRKKRQNAFEKLVVI